jgi:hypothetical protein
LLARRSRCVRVRVSCIAATTIIAPSLHSLHGLAKRVIDDHQSYSSLAHDHVDLKGCSGPTKHTHNKQTKRCCLEVLSHTMGGQPRFPFPKYVWTPYGGWWVAAPPHHKRNLALVVAGTFVFGIVPVFLISAANEVCVRCDGLRCCHTRHHHASRTISIAAVTNSKQWRSVVQALRTSSSTLTNVALGLHRTTQRRNVPLKPIPSQRWSAHALEDDPEYPQKLKDYKRNAPSLWARILP